MAVITSPPDVFVFGGILVFFITLVAAVGKSPILGAFSGVLAVLLGVYGLINDIGFGSLNPAVAVTVIGLGIYLIFEAHRGG